MGKLLFWAVVIVAGLLIARLLSRSAHSRTHKATPPPPSDGTELMVRCAHCGILQPSSEAVRRKGYNYCSLAHSLKGPRA